MKQRHRDDPVPATLDALIETITVDAHGDDEKFSALRQAFEDHIVVPRKRRGERASGPRRTAGGHLR